MEYIHVHVHVHAHAHTHTRAHTRALTGGEEWRGAGLLPATGGVVPAGPPGGARQRRVPSDGHAQRQPGARGSHPVHQLSDGAGRSGAGGNEQGRPQATTAGTYTCRHAPHVCAVVQMLICLVHTTPHVLHV